MYHMLRELAVWPFAKMLMVLRFWNIFNSLLCMQYVVLPQSHSMPGHTEKGGYHEHKIKTLVGVQPSSSIISPFPIFEILIMKIRFNYERLCNVKILGWVVLNRNWHLIKKWTSQIQWFFLIMAQIMAIPYIIIFAHIIECAKYTPANDTKKEMFFLYIEGGHFSITLFGIRNKSHFG